MSSIPIPLLFIPIIIPPSSFAIAANHTQYDQGTITIPTSTVLSIGLGFLVFSFSILVVLLLFRLNRIRKLSKSQNRKFKECWRDEGGFWGFLTSFGDLGNNGNAFNQSSLIGATGRTLNYDLGFGTRNLIRGLLDDDEQEEKDRLRLKEKPVLWDCSWYNNNEEKINDSDYHGDRSKEDDTLQPLSVIPPSIPITTSKAAPPSSSPQLNLCVLIAFPSQTIYDPTSEELPELIIGSTTLLPTIMHSGADLKRVESDSSDLAHDGLEKKMEIQEIEYSDSPNVNSGTIIQNDSGKQSENHSKSQITRKRAEWKLDHNGVWYIDGLGSN